MDDVKTIQDILALFDKHQLAELSLESGEFKLSLKSGRFPAVQYVQQTLAAAPSPSYAQASAGGQSEHVPPVQSPVSYSHATSEKEDVLASVDFETAVADAFEAGDREAQQKLAEQAGWTAIKSPMMGTFYAAPKPDAEAFAKKGDKKKKGQVLCIIEAMKMMNELPAPADCEIKMVAVKDGQIIEYGQVIFYITKG